MNKHLETFARKMILLLGKAKMHGMRGLRFINDRLSTFVTQLGRKMDFVQRSLIILSCFMVLGLAIRQYTTTLF